MSGTINTSYAPWNLAQVLVPSASVKTMYTTPVLLLPTPSSASYYYDIQQIELAVSYGGTQYTAGGTIVFQYDNTASGAGDQATQTYDATSFNAISSNRVIYIGPLTTSTSLSVANVTGKGLYISNQTAVFASGNSDIVISVWYDLINPFGA